MELVQEYAGHNLHDKYSILYFFHGAQKKWHTIIYDCCRLHSTEKCLDFCQGLVHCCHPLLVLGHPCSYNLYSWRVLLALLLSFHLQLWHHILDSQRTRLLLTIYVINESLSLRGFDGWFSEFQQVPLSWCHRRHSKVHMGCNCCVCASGIAHRCMGTPSLHKNE